MARSMLIGAPVLLAQIDISEILNTLSAGDEKALDGLNLAVRGTAKQFILTLSEASPRAVLRLIHSD